MDFLLAGMVAILGMEKPKILWFLDMPSLLLIVGFLILGLGISGQMRHFGIGLKAACVKGNVLEKIQLEKADYPDLNLSHYRNVVA